MNTIQPITKLLIEILCVNEKKDVSQICLIETPSAQPVPRVGDEISIHKSMEEKIGTNKTIFRVLKRRFPIQPDGIFQTKVVLFVSTDLE